MAIKKMQFGILGYSHVAQKSAIPALMNSPKASLVAIGRRQDSEGYPHEFDKNDVVFCSYEEVLSDPRIEAVYISLPNSLHEFWTIKAAAAGKHVWCEKPITLSYESAKKIAEAGEKNNVHIREGFTFLFHPQHQHVKKLIKENAIGNISAFYGQFTFPMPDKGNIRLDKKLGGGSYTDAAVYPIRASRFLFEAEPISVFCHLTEDPAFGIDIKADLILSYSEGRVAHISSSFGSYFQSHYSLLGSTGMIQTERAYAVPSTKSITISLERDDKTNTEIIPPVNQFELFIDDFVQSAYSNKKDALYRNDILAQARIVDAGFRSNLKKRSVDLIEIE